MCEIEWNLVCTENEPVSNTIVTEMCRYDRIAGVLTLPHFPSASKLSTLTEQNILKRHQLLTYVRHNLNK